MGRLQADHITCNSVRLLPLNVYEVVRLCQVYEFSEKPIFLSTTEAKLSEL